MLVLIKTNFAVALGFIGSFLLISLATTYFFELWPNHGKSNTIFIYVGDIFLTTRFLFILLRFPSSLGKMGIVLYISGTILNNVALVFNGFKMPVDIRDPRDAWFALELSSSFTHCHLAEKTKFKYLCDKFRGNNSMYSLGDILILLGIYLVALS